MHNDVILFSQIYNYYSASKNILEKSTVFPLLFFNKINGHFTAKSLKSLATFAFRDF